MSLIQHAERELRDAGLFDADSDYEGGLGEAVLELVKKFSEQGHSGASAASTIAIFKIVANYGILSPLKNPMITGDYMDVGDYGGPDRTGKVFQSTRKYSVFSEDGGKTWYDIDKKVPWHKRIFGVKRHYLKFA